MAKAQKEKDKLSVIEEVNDYSEDDFVADVKEKVTKKNYDATKKFQDTWAAGLPWAELFRGSNGLFEYVKCVVCSLITEKPKILGQNWDTLSKYGGKLKATYNMPNGIKKGQWYIAKEQCQCGTVACNGQGRASKEEASICNHPLAAPGWTPDVGICCTTTFTKFP